MITPHVILHDESFAHALKRLTDLAKTVTETSDDMVAVRTGYIVQVVNRAEAKIAEVCAYRHRTYRDEINAVEIAAYQFVLDTIAAAHRAINADPVLKDRQRRLLYAGEPLRTIALAELGRVA